MDISIQRALSDKVYDRRKGGALELEKLIREAVAANNWDKVAKVVDQLCHDYAYAIHQPYARNGGLIGLAAASIALGPDVARYLEQIVPPVLACFGDHDARVRYYACESMYNIAKTSKGEILPYFNEVFDALSKLAADSELSVKNGAELLDRLIKDIVSESATSYVSMVNQNPTWATTNESNLESEDVKQASTAFSLARFMPLLQERIYVINPFTRMFLVSWITLLDCIPDLELVTYLPSFLGGLFKFLSDQNQDVVTATQHVLERFLDEIKYVAKIKRGVAKTKGTQSANGRSNPMAGKETDRSGRITPADEADSSSNANNEDNDANEQDRSSVGDAMSSTMEENDDVDDSSELGPSGQDDWIPGQDVRIDHPQILEILVKYLRESPEEHIQLTALRWIDSFFEICPEDILPFAPRILNQVLPALSSGIGQVRQAGIRVNASLMEYVLSLPDNNPQYSSTSRSNDKEVVSQQAANIIDQKSAEKHTTTSSRPPTPFNQKEKDIEPDKNSSSLDYEAAVASLTLQFLNEHEATRIAALSWLIMLQQKAPRQVLAAQDGTFPALLKTLSDPSDTVVKRDLQLLSQISRNSDDTYFTSFMVNLLQLFCTDRRLLETRGNLIIRQLCLNLSPERIYRTMADCLEKDEDVEFSSIMVQNLNNNLITAPELADLRRKLRHWDSRESQSLFVTLFRAWCNNAVATISLCLLAQAYEQAYNLLQTFADLEMSVNTLIQIDKLVQLLESPVFTYLRLQLLEPATTPYLYKTLYGILMLLPQSAAFAALKNRLNSISGIGYLYVPQPQQSSARGNTPAQTSTSSTNTTAYERANRVKPREDTTGPIIKWTELLEKFRSIQEKKRRAGMPTAGWNEEQTAMVEDARDGLPGSLGRRLLPAPDHGPRANLKTPPDGIGHKSASSGDLSKFSSMGPPSHPGPSDLNQDNQSHGLDQSQLDNQQGKDGKEGWHKSKFSASHLGRFASGVKNKTKK